MLKIWILSSIILIGFCTISQATTLKPRAFLKLPFSAPGARLGSAVAVNAPSNEVAVGAPKFNGSGVVDTFFRKNYLWYHDSVILPPYPASSIPSGVQPLFENSIDLYSFIDYNNTANTYHLLAIGTPGLSVVYIYISTYNANTLSFEWRLNQNITNAQNPLNWGRRLSFATNSPQLLIGGDKAAQLYTCNRTMCALISILQAPDISPLPVFGERVLITTSFAFVGSYQAANDAGIVLVYPLPSTPATPQNPSVLTASQTLSPTSATSPRIEFGKSLSFYGSNLVIGAPYEATRGVAYWYTFNTSSSSFTLRYKITPPSANANSFSGFGDAVSVDASDIIIGADMSGQGVVFNYRFPINDNGSTPFTQWDELTPPDTDPANTNFADAITNRGSGAFIIGYNGDSTGTTGVINEDYAKGSGSNASSLSGAAYIASQDCGLTITSMFGNNSYGTPFTDCNTPSITQNRFDATVLEPAIIPAGITLTLHPNTNSMTFNSDLSFSNGTYMLTNNNTEVVSAGTLVVTAGTTIVVKGKLYLNNSVLVMDIEHNTAYQPTKGAITVPLFETVASSDGAVFKRIDLKAKAPSLECQRYVTSLERSEEHEKGMSVRIELDETECELEAEEEASLVLSVVFVALGLPILLILAGISQYYLSLISGETQ